MNDFAEAGNELNHRNAKGETMSRAKKTSAEAGGSRRLRNAFADILKMFDWSDAISDPDGMDDNEIVEFLKEQQKNKTECFLDEDFTLYNGKILGLKPETVRVLKEFGVPTPPAWDKTFEEAVRIGLIAGGLQKETENGECIPRENASVPQEAAESSANEPENESPEDENPENGPEGTEKKAGKQRKVNANGKIARMFAAIAPFLENGIEREEAVRIASEKVGDIDAKTVRVQLLLATRKAPSSYGKILEVEGKGKTAVYRVKKN